MRGGVHEEYQISQKGDKFWHWFKFFLWLICFLYVVDWFINIAVNTFKV